MISTSSVLADRGAVLDVSKHGEVIMDNTTVSFEDWHDRLCEVAKKNGGSAADEDAWRPDYEAGMTPEESWEDAWG